MANFIERALLLDQIKKEEREYQEWLSNCKLPQDKRRWLPNTWGEEGKGFQPTIDGLISSRNRRLVGLAGVIVGTVAAKILGLF